MKSDVRVFSFKR